MKQPQLENKQIRNTRQKHWRWKEHVNVHNGGGFAL